MGSAFVIFPNNLFVESVDILKNYNTIYLFEEPIHFYDPNHRPYKVNQVKLTFMRASMKAFEFYLRSQGIDVKYVEYQTLCTLGHKNNVTLRK